VYGQAIEPGDWTDGELICLTELRRIHSMAMTPVWDIVPHSHAIPEESPGSFRRHDIAAFPGGMRPPSWVRIGRLAPAVRDRESPNGTSEGYTFEQKRPCTSGYERAISAIGRRKTFPKPWATLRSVIELDERLALA
jgi:hypothetical protein